MPLHPRAGLPPTPDQLTDLPRLLTAYYTLRPDPAVAAERVSFGTSGHRGSALRTSFNEDHILAVTEAVCQYRRQAGIDGPLFLGMDSHALSIPAHATALEVLAAHGVEVVMAEGETFTPTPVISRAILVHNARQPRGRADGLILTPSHNPPADGGIKYNPPHGGPADSAATAWIEAKANALLQDGLREVLRIPLARARAAATTHARDFAADYVAELGEVIDFEAIRGAGLRLGVDPLGGAGVHYWARIAEAHRLDLTVVNPHTDATFRFLTLDWDGRIRMDPSSPHAMRGLIDLKDRFDLAFACDTDHDRHGIVTRSAGLLPANHFLSVCIEHLFQHRPHWRADARVGKTLVSSRMIDRVAARRGRAVHEVPVGFKWFVDGLVDGALAFVGEESAGATFARRDGKVWTTDKDGLAPALLAAEIMAVAGRDPGEVYRGLAADLGDPVYDRVDAVATPEQKAKLAKLSPEQVRGDSLAGEPIRRILTRAPGNDAPLGGLKVETDHGWFAARPSGTEDIYKIYAESFLGADHLRRLQVEAQELVTAALA
jgi:phosphoglucomutase